jgi:hypothetical protein
LLYKVTPMLVPQPEKRATEAVAQGTKEPRKRRRSAVFDADGNEVLITMRCLKCDCMRPLAMFGLRKMADGSIRNQPWCRTCRSNASSQKRKTAPDANAPVSETVFSQAAPSEAEGPSLEDVVVAVTVETAGASPDGVVTEPSVDVTSASADEMAVQV